MSENGATEREPDQKGGRPARQDGGQSEPDVLLDIPEVTVDQIRLSVRGLDADLSLRARLANLLQLDAGVRVHLDDVELDVTGVSAEVLLKVRLEKLMQILDRALTSIDRNPHLIEALARVAVTDVEEVNRVARQLAGAPVRDESGQRIGTVGAVADRPLREGVGRLAPPSPAVPSRARAPEPPIGEQAHPAPSPGQGRPKPPAGDQGQPKAQAEAGGRGTGAPPAGGGEQPSTRGGGGATREGGPASRQGGGTSREGWQPGAGGPSDAGAGRPPTGQAPSGAGGPSAAGKAAEPGKAGEQAKPAAGGKPEEEAKKEPGGPPGPAQLAGQAGETLLQAGRSVWEAIQNGMSQHRPKR